MGTFYSFIAGVEKHHDPMIPDVGYAAKDARAFADALERIGFLPDHREVLVNAEVTGTNLRYGIKQCLRSANEEDTVFIFFSGHGFSAPTGPRLVAHDSRFHNMEDTSVAIDEVFTHIRESSCRRVALFLDCCHAGLTFPAGEKNVLAQMDASELKSFFAASEFHVAFGSCKRNEKSYWSDVLGHGVWSYHLLQALSGSVPEILESDRYLRAANLQDYLARAVAKTLRDKFTERKHQTPVLYGSVTSNFLVADLEAVLPKPNASKAPLTTRFTKASFGHIEEGRVSQLPGFDKKKGHFPPTDHSSFSERFVAKAGDEMVQDKATELYDKIKATFGYTRQELTLNPETGSATIRAKDFDVALSVMQSPDDPEQYRFLLDVDEFSGGEIVAADGFNEVFDGEFSFLKLALDAEQDIPALIDRIEAKKPAGVKINYQREGEPNWVSITVEGQQARVVVGKKWIKVKLLHSEPRDFVDALNSAQGLSLDGNGKATLGSLLFPALQAKLTK